MSAYTLRERAPLQARNTFRVAATAALMAEVRRPEGLAELLAFPAVRTMPVLVLGEGSNVLFAGDFPGLVITQSAAAIAMVGEDERGVLVRAEAGVVWNDMVNWSVGHGLAGLENLALIPGTVGACPIQNIGAYGCEVGEVIETVEAFDRQSLSQTELSTGDCGFGYRDSVFKRQPERWVITAVRFRLPRERAPRLDYAGVREELAALGAGDAPRPSQIAEAIARIRSRKLPDPLLQGNAGSFFKNPELDEAEALALQAAHPGLPAWPAGPGRRKLSAAWLIEACGLKGHREGDAGVSAQHALVLVNHGQASGAQILALALRVRDAVAGRFGLRLEPEPRILGADPAALAALGA